MFALLALTEKGSQNQESFELKKNVLEWHILW